MSNVSNLKTDQYSTRIQASQKQQVEEKQLPIRNDSANFPTALFAKFSIRVIIFVVFLRYTLYIKANYFCKYNADI